MPWEGRRRGGGGEEERREGEEKLSCQYIHLDFPLLSFSPMSSVQLDVEPTACVVAIFQRELVLLG